MHSESATHERQRPTPSTIVRVHAFVAGLHEKPSQSAASVATRHATQAPASQYGWPAMWAQSSSTTQGAQVGAAPLVSQRLPVEAVQSALSSHSTHSPEGVQARRPIVQSLGVRQSTHSWSGLHSEPLPTDPQSSFPSHSTQVSMTHAGRLEGQREQGPPSMGESGANASVPGGPASAEPASAGQIALG
jgi:hypothetical protein